MTALLFFAAQANVREKVCTAGAQGGIRDAFGRAVISPLRRSEPGAGRMRPVCCRLAAYLPR